jgi:hypothetical protein
MAEEIVAQGGLISDDIMLKVVTSRLDSLQNKVRVPFATWMPLAYVPYCSTGFSTASRGHWAKENSWTNTYGMPTSYAYSLSIYTL